MPSISSTPPSLLPLFTARFTTTSLPFTTTTTTTTTLHSLKHATRFTTQQPPSSKSLRTLTTTSCRPSNTTAASSHRSLPLRPRIQPAFTRPSPPTRTMANNSNALGVHSKKHRVAIVGSGNWGTTIAKVVGENVLENPDLFEQEVPMWVFEEEYTIPKDSKHYDAGSALCTKPQKLTALINGLHENVKYLPGVPLPKNIVANPDLASAVEGATILVFNLPHQFIAKTCQSIVGKIVPYARGISCIKGVAVSDDGCELFSESIGRELGIYCGALSGANIANEVAQEKWSETTVAYDPPKMDSKHPTPQGTPQGSHLDLTKLNVDEQQQHPSKKVKLQPKLAPLPSEYPPLHHSNMKKLFHRPYFHVRMVHDVAGVSLGGALKNVVALAAGWVDGLGWGDNAKAAVMRVGIMEEVRFGKMFFTESTRTETFTEESCGVADLITSCSGGRNFRCAKMSVAEGKPIGEIEERELNGQKLQGTSTAYEVYSFLKKEGKEGEFPLFSAVRNILEGVNKPADIPDLIEAGPAQKEDDRTQQQQGMDVHEVLKLAEEAIQKRGPHFMVKVLRSKL